MSVWRSGSRAHRLILRLLIAFVAFVPPGLAKAAGTLKGVALVIGNADYSGLPKLANPVNDAREIEALLDSLGFEVFETSDRDAKRLRRDLEAFVEDAEGADVAVLYYSGHGIEAGGENYLVPVDADLSSLDNASERLVPFSGIVERLQAKVPVAIILLDACRNNPFPAGTALRTSPGSAPFAVSASGLGEARSVVASNEKKGDEPNNFGMVIGFAAAPGQAALDGLPGSNSPYASAMIKHLAAMPGEEFGTVMRMVTEEVYLKTGGGQRPWINESLRRLLYFGKAPQPTEDADQDILTERRQLLLTIAALPDVHRRRVETMAAQGGVPMDALYGMLRALGADTPNDPAELDKLLQDQAEKLKEIMAERASLASPDPEIQRLSKLAEEALAEGALDANVKFREAAKARFAELASTLDTAEANLKNQRLAGGEVFGKTAEAYELKGDYLAAAENYGEGYRQVERRDDLPVVQVTTVTTHKRIRM
jgi:uncharacterized caspase-like protein